MTADSEKEIKNEIRAQARAWFVRRLQNITQSQEQKFDAWRHADPEHERAYRDVEATWRATEIPGQRIAAREADELEAYLKAMDRPKPQRRVSRRLATTSIVLLLVLGAATWLSRPNLLQNLTADYATERGERRNVVLSDGSAVLLDADSALDERFTPQERRVTLLRGTAFFDIAGGKRPFIVNAANGEIRDIGTRFDVGLVEDGAAITLERGKVSLTVDKGMQPIVLEPGQHIQFGPLGPGPVERVDLEDALAWRGGRYVFYRKRLSDVLAEIARYRQGRILITSRSLGDQLVTGSFSLADTDAALSSLKASVGFRLLALTSALTVISP